MKKVLFAIMGIGLLFASCTKNHIPEIEQNPYRMIIPYTPGTVEMTVPGDLTPVGDYSSWLIMSQNGGKATFTVRRNTQNLIRRAEFKIAGSSQLAIINQRAHTLDANLTLSLDSQGLGSATVALNVASEFIDDYAGWGVIYGKEADMAKGTKVAQTGAPVLGKNLGTVTGLENGVDYYFWAYAESTEGDLLYSNMLAVMPPVCVKAGEDFYAAFKAAKEYQEIRVEGGAVLTKTIEFTNDCKNKVVSGGWNSDFTEQSMDNLTVLDLSKAGYGVTCTGAAGAMEALDGSAEISYFEIKNCKGDHGSAIRACGGPVTVHHCYVHDNEAEKGAIGTNEGGYKTTLTVYNCIVSDNIGTGHGAAFGFGEGKSDTEPVTATLVNNLIVDNVSTKKDGYCSTFICYNQTILVLANNTIVGNKNWAEYGGPYPGQNLRGDVASCFVNNIMVGNMTSPCTHESDVPVYERQNKFFSMGGGAGTLANNMIEGELNDAANATVQDQIDMPLGFDLSTVLTSDYKPLGKALGAGTLAEITYNSKKADMKGPFKVNMKSLLETYNTDLAGNARVVNGKVDLGCYQAQ